MSVSVCSQRRGSATDDTRVCKDAFSKLGFEVIVRKNLKTSDLQNLLQTGIVNQFPSNVEDMVYIV